MLGIVLVGHGAIAQSYIDVAESMLGKQASVACVGYSIGDDLDNTRTRIAQAIKAVDTHRGVIVMADMFGGVPANLSISVAQGLNAEVICGMNLSMVLKLLTVREVLSVSNAAKEVQQTGVKYINVLSDVLQAHQQTRVS